MSDRSKLLILTYHGICENPNKLRSWQHSARDFERHMSVLSRFCNVLTVSEGARLLHSGELPSRSVCISFDDGYRNNRVVALPILQRYGLRATFFVATGFLDGGLMWNDAIIEAIQRASVDFIDLRDHGLGSWAIRSASERQGAVNELINALKYRSVDERKALVTRLVERAGAILPNNLMLSSGEVRELFRAGMEIGAHTVNHPILTQTAPDAAEREIEASKSTLEDITGASVNSFAYPNGRPGIDFDDSHRALVRKLGFGCAVSTLPGVATREDDVFALRRLAPWDTRSSVFALRLIAYFSGIRS